MSPQPTPDQARRRRQVEGVIRLIAPALDLVLAAGERVSRIVQPGDVEYYPPRTKHEERTPPSAATEA